MKTIAEYLGYITVISIFIGGAYKLILPYLKSIFNYNKVVSVDNINHINEIAYRALYKSETLIDHIGIAEYVCTPDGACIYASKRLCELFEKSEIDMLGFGWTLSIVEDERDLAYHKWINSVKEKTPYEHTYHIYSKNIKDTILVRTKTRVCFKFNPIEKKKTDEILFYIGTVIVI